jgi:hypothetical protein
VCRAGPPRNILANLDLLHFGLGIFPGSLVGFGPVNVAFGEGNHITLQIHLLLALEAFEILQNAGTGVLDILLRYLEGLLKLAGMLAW